MAACVVGFVVTLAMRTFQIHCAFSPAQFYSALLNSWRGKGFFFSIGVWSAGHFASWKYVRVLETSIPSILAGCRRGNLRVTLCVRRDNDAF